MAKGKKNWIVKIIMMFGLPAFIALKQVVAPFFEETGKMKAEAIKLEEAIKSVKNDSAVYSENWQEEMRKREQMVLVNLPENINPSEVMRYFSTQFQKDHKGIEFTSLVPTQPTQSAVQADKDNASIKARVSKLQIKGKMPANMLMPYLEHVEAYKGAYKITEINIVPEGDKLKEAKVNLDLGLELFLVPKDWLPAAVAKKVESETEKVRAVASTQSSDIKVNANDGWFQTDEILKKEEIEMALAKEVKDAEPLPPPPKPVVPKFPEVKITKFMGKSIVIGENIFEEGDMVYGWKIDLINPKEKLIQLHNGKYIKKLVVK